MSWSQLLTIMSNVVFSCHSCGTAIPLAPREKVARKSECPRCGADLHCCLNCRFYDHTKNNQCAEPQAEWVRDKERSNFCDYFEPDASARPGRGQSSSDPRKSFDDLFE
jgi:hypothetical protein